MRESERIASYAKVLGKEFSEVYGLDELTPKQRKRYRKKRRIAFKRSSQGVTEAHDAE